MLPFGWEEGYTPEGIKYYIEYESHKLWNQRVYFNRKIILRISFHFNTSLLYYAFYWLPIMFRIFSLNYKQRNVISLKQYQSNIIHLHVSQSHDTNDELDPSKYTCGHQYHEHLARWAICCLILVTAIVSLPLFELLFTSAVRKTIRMLAAPIIQYNEYFE